MANGAMVYTTASRTRCKGEVHRGGCGCDARTLFPRRNEWVAVRRGPGETWSARRTRPPAQVRCRTARGPADGYGSRTVGWMSVPVPARGDGLTSRLPVRL